MRPFPFTLSRLKLSSGFGTIRYILLCSSRGQRGEKSGVEWRGDESEEEEIKDRGRRGDERRTIEGRGEEMEGMELEEEGRRGVMEWRDDVGRNERRKESRKKGREKETSRDGGGG